jgi:hypothetical protein
MRWLLVLTLQPPDGAPVEIPAGIMVDRDICIVAGGGAAAVLEQANPGLIVAWTCLPQAGVDA